MEPTRLHSRKLSDHAGKDNQRYCRILLRIYTKGDITVEDVFNSFSLGIGKDGVAGYPLISAYLTGKELKLAAEVDASYRWRRNCQCAGIL